MQRIYILHILSFRLQEIVFLHDSPQLAWPGQHQGVVSLQPSPATLVKKQILAC